MTRQRHLLAALLLTLTTLGTGAAQSAEDQVSKVMGSITIAPGEHAGKLTTVNGSIEVGDNAVVAEARTVNGSIRLGEHLSNVNGSIRVREAHVGGDIETVSGSLEVGPDAHVDGGIHVREDSSDTRSREPPRIVIGPGSTVKGTLRFDRPVRLYVSDRASIGTVQGATAVKFSGDRPPE